LGRRKHAKNNKRKIANTLHQNRRGHQLMRRGWTVVNGTDEKMILLIKEGDEK